MSCDASRYSKDASRVGWGATLNGKRSTKVIELTQSGSSISSSRAHIVSVCHVEAKQPQVMTAT